MVMINGYDQWFCYLCYFGSYYNVIRITITKHNHSYYVVML